MKVTGRERGREGKGEGDRKGKVKGREGQWNKTINE